MEELFGEVIHRTTRAQLIEDGELVDVSEMAREAGIRFSVVATRALWSDIGNIPPRFKGFQDVSGRLWDVLWMSRGAIRYLASEATKGRELPLRACYTLIMHVGRKSNYVVKVHLGLGDNGEPVITLFQGMEVE